MSHLENRSHVIDRVKRELIGPGSDIFLPIDGDPNQEVIADKPLSRYFSAILFPKETNKPEEKSDAEGASLDDSESTEPVFEDGSETGQNTDTEAMQPKVSGSEEDESQDIIRNNTFFPSQYGLSFCLDNNTTTFNLEISFGLYSPAEFKDIVLPLGTGDTELYTKLDHYITVDEENKVLRLKKKITAEISKSATSNLKDYRNSDQYKRMVKIFFKGGTHYKRTQFNATIAFDLSQNKAFEMPIDGYLNAPLPKNLKETLYVTIKHFKRSGLNFIKVLFENRKNHNEKFIFNEKLTEICLFQTEIKVLGRFLPFKGIESKMDLPKENKVLNYGFRKKEVYGIGHNTACIWDSQDVDEITPTWIGTSFMPMYDVKGQTTKSDDISADVLNIKTLSSFNLNKDRILDNLKQVPKAYYKWIKGQKDICESDKIFHEYGFENIGKCEKIYQRILEGIELLEKDSAVFQAFQLANTAIYIQMVQHDEHFKNKREGFEAFEKRDAQFNYTDYAELEGNFSWRPFQLAFILQCLPSMVDSKHPDRALVDLLYFPTGGGKTEAYLGLSAFIIFWRRLVFPDTYGGVNIMMRYTLRLLSAQQFERATKLILACEFIRQNHTDLGKERISIGFWVGDGVIPNKRSDAQKKLNEALNNLNAGRVSNNPLQLSTCQWCNTKIISKTEENADAFRIGHEGDAKIKSYCLNPKCNFTDGTDFPIILVDEDIYDHPPTLLFATVDKFAQITWKEKAGALFGGEKYRKPELIIQDELHLLSGTLGSMVGLYENLILDLCSNNEQKPKIIASTATIKNVDAQIKGLYGREMHIFPQYATDAENTFFSKTDTESKRRYIGILPTGKTVTMTNLRLNAALFLARLEIWEKDKVNHDKLWTILGYFKSLKELGRFHNKTTSELPDEVKQLQVRNLKNNDYEKEVLNYLQISNYDKNVELTSRISSAKIKQSLDKLANTFEGISLKERDALDIVSATNMISVGLDVGRLNLMVMNGMPPNTAEYIQASSRVARQDEGIVFTLYNPNTSRDLSYFEDFIYFHKTFYKQVDPLSVTPFAPRSLEKMLFSLIIGYYRHKQGYSKNDAANHLKQENIRSELKEAVLQLLRQNTFLQEDKYDQKCLEEAIEACIDVFKNLEKNKTYFMKVSPKNIGEALLTHEPSHERFVMGSMRSVEPQATIQIELQK